MSKLELRVKAKNIANDHANKLYDRLCLIFQPLVGTKILKATGGFMKSVQKLLPTHEELIAYQYSGPGYINIRINTSGSSYSLGWEIDVYLSNGNMHTSESSTVSLGKMYNPGSSVYIASDDKLFLKEIYKHPEHRTNWTVEEVLNKRKIFEEAENAYREARSNLCWFGEYDR